MTKKRGQAARREERVSEPPPVKRISETGGEPRMKTSVHVVVPPNEKQDFMDWAFSCDFADLKSALRWGMWYLRTYVDSEDVKRILGGQKP